jgi:hypothetical protein
MAAHAGLSVAANVLPVIGLADTVFRAGKSLYDVIENARSASGNAPSLLHDSSESPGGKVEQPIRRFILEGIEDVESTTETMVQSHEILGMMSRVPQILYISIASVRKSSGSAVRISKSTSRSTRHWSSILATMPFTNSRNQQCYFNMRSIRVLRN